MIELKTIIPIGDFILKDKSVKPTMLPDGAYYHYVDVCSLLSRIQKQGQWIEVAQELPFNTGSFICTAKDGSVGECLWDKLKKRWVIRDAFNNDRWLEVEVTHWQPLPEPAKS